MEKDYRSCKVLEVCLTQAIKFLEFMFREIYVDSRG